MKNDKILITEDLIKSGYSKDGKLSFPQIKLLGGVMAELNWERRVIGTKISKREYDRFLRLKDYEPPKTTFPVNKVFIRKPKKKSKNKQNRHKDPTTYTAYDNFLKQKVRVMPDMPMADQYNHPNWQRLRSLILDRDKYTCQSCGNKHEQLHVHHKKYMKNGFIWDTRPEDLVTICKSCHHKEHGRVF